MKAGSDTLHNVGEKVTDVFLDPAGTIVEELVVVVWLSQQAARLLTSNTNSHVLSEGTAPTKLRVLCNQQKVNTNMYCKYTQYKSIQVNNAQNNGFSQTIFQQPILYVTKRN